MVEMDTFMKLDKSIGTISAAIMYASPPWARYEGCTGFPWGSTMYKYGCVPRDDVMEDWADYNNFISERYNGSDPSMNKMTYFVIWNEVGNAGWMDGSPIIPNRVDNSNPINDTAIEWWKQKYVDIMWYARKGLRWGTA